MELLSKANIKKILKELSNLYGIRNLKLNYLFFKNPQNKIYIINKDYNKLKDSKFNAIGLYFAKRELPGLRLSIEGSQIIGPLATKNIFEIKDLKDYMTSKNIPCDKKLKSFVIIKHKEDYLGSGLYKQEKILNYLPKERRLKFTLDI